MGSPGKPWDFLRIAHRGASGECPENTLAAFRRAIEQSAGMIECDLQLTWFEVMRLLGERGG